MSRRMEEVFPQAEVEAERVLVTIEAAAWGVWLMGPRPHEGTAAERIGGAR